MRIRWVATCVDCNRLIAKDGIFRQSPMGGERRQQVISGTGCKAYQQHGSGMPGPANPESYCQTWGCYYGDCSPLVTESTGWHHRDCGVALHAGAPEASENNA